MSLTAEQIIPRFVYLWRWLPSILRFQWVNLTIQPTVLIDLYPPGELVLDQLRYRLRNSCILKSLALTETLFIVIKSDLLKSVPNADTLLCLCRNRMLSRTRTRPKSIRTPQISHSIMRQRFGARCWKLGCWVSSFPSNGPSSGISDSTSFESPLSVMLCGSRYGLGV
jgi:hypothetical protein